MSNPFGDYGTVDLGQIYGQWQAANGNATGTPASGGTTPPITQPLPPTPAPGSPTATTPPPGTPPGTPPGGYLPTPTGGPTTDAQGNLNPGVGTPGVTPGLGNPTTLVQDGAGNWVTGVWQVQPDGSYKAVPAQGATTGYTPDGTPFAVGADYSGYVGPDGQPTGAYTDANGYHAAAGQEMYGARSAPYGGTEDPSTFLGYHKDGVTPWFYGGGGVLGPQNANTDARLWWYENGLNTQNYRDPTYLLTSDSAPRSALTEDELTRLSAAMYNGGLMGMGVENNNGNVIPSRVAQMSPADWNKLNGADQQAYFNYLNQHVTRDASGNTVFTGVPMTTMLPPGYVPPSPRPGDAGYSAPAAPAASGSPAPATSPAPQAPPPANTAHPAATNSAKNASPTAGKPAAAASSAIISQPTEPKSTYNPIVANRNAVAGLVQNTDANGNVTSVHSGNTALIGVATPNPTAQYGVQYITQPNGQNQAQVVNNGAS